MLMCCVHLKHSKIIMNIQQCLTCEEVLRLEELRPVRGRGRHRHETAGPRVGVDAGRVLLGWAVAVRLVELVHLLLAAGQLATQLETLLLQRLDKHLDRERTENVF